MDTDLREAIVAIIGILILRSHFYIIGVTQASTTPVIFYLTELSLIALSRDYFVFVFEKNFVRVASRRSASRVESY